MSTDLLNKCKDYIDDFFNNNLGGNCKYHNKEHTTGVINAALRLSEEAGLTEDEKADLHLAALFHDTGYCMGPNNHEAKSAEIADNFLLEKDIPAIRRKRIVDLIKATELSWNGDDKLSLLLRDADLSGLAAKDYKENAEKLRIEKSTLSDAEISQDDWAEENIRFLSSHRYNTKEGRKLFKKGKKKNLKKLIAMKESKKEKNKTIASSKSAQTQLKTTLRNHIDLSAIADNKANIMLSVNAVVITVGLPLLADRMIEQPILLWPAAILALSSVISIIYATLATRPIKMNGLTSFNDIGERKTNLFFFGNFYKMKFENYEDGIKEVVANDDLLDNSITRDLFFLGKSLGAKYDHLRNCYNIFMTGIVTAVIVGVIVMVVS